MELAEISFHDVDGGAEVPGEKKKSLLAVPGKPSFAFYSAVGK